MHCTILSSALAPYPLDTVSTLPVSLDDQRCLQMLQVFPGAESAPPETIVVDNCMVVCDPVFLFLLECWPPFSASTPVAPLSLSD